MDWVRRYGHFHQMKNRDLADGERNPFFFYNPFSIFLCQERQMARRTVGFGAATSDVGPQPMPIASAAIKMIRQSVRITVSSVVTSS